MNDTAKRQCIAQAVRVAAHSSTSDDVRDKLEQVVRYAAMPGQTVADALTYYGTEGRTDKVGA